MKIIEIMNKVANGEIKKGTKFILNDALFIFNGRMFESNELFYLGNCIFLKEEDLNKEVELIPPKPKKYYLRLSEDDKFSYINWVERSSYSTSSKFEVVGYKAKFTQEEIDNDKFLKFIEQHGIKEEVKDNETD